MYSQTMAARFDCKKLLRFALATLCLLALAMFMPVAARAEGDPTETKSWTCQKDGTTYLDVARNGGTTQDHNVGTATLKVHVWQPNGPVINLEEKDFYYHYNNHKDDDLSTNLNTDYASDKTITKAFGNLNDEGGKGDGGYGSVDLILTAADGYKIYAVEYTVCHSSGGPSNTGWRDDTDNTKKVTNGIPTQNYYLDNVTDNTTVDIYLMQEYTVRYQVRYNNQTVQNPGDYLESYTTDLLADAEAYPNGPTATVHECGFLNDITAEKLADTNSLYGYHRWCDRENEPNAVNLAVSRFKEGYTVATTVTVPTLTAKEGYKVSGWKVDENNTVGFGNTVNMSGLAKYADENRVITLTAVVEVNTPNTDNNGNNNGNGDNGGNNGGDGGNGGTTDGDNNNNGGDNGNNGGQESTTTPTPETTPASTPSVTTVTAVAPTATPTATPAPTAEPTATPAPAAVSAHIPQTSDDMPYTLLVVTALASLCAAGAMFKKRRSK